MAKYYYNKYDSVALYTAPSWTFQNLTDGVSSRSGFSSVYWDGGARTWVGAGNVVTNNWGNGAESSLIFTSSQKTERYVGTSIQNQWGFYVSFHNGPDSTLYYAQGGLVQSNIIAEDGTYPANGRAADGYWYVRGALVFPAIKVNIGGVWKAGAAGSVNIGGVWKSFSDMWVNVDGIWKKS